jgi:hypothetical protein
MMFKQQNTSPELQAELVSGEKAIPGACLVED